jgi:hypothetical protein
MNTEDIIRMAREAGAMFDHITWVERDLAPVFERFFQAAYAAGADAEREVCAKVCDVEASVHVTNASEQYQEGRSMGAVVCAAAIRARGEQT